MDIHRDISDVINNVVLRDVVQVHGMEIPYPAELWVDGECEHEHGTAMFSIGDRGLLTAEYFGYDNVWNKLEWRGMGFAHLDAKLIMKDTRVEIPIWWISVSPKARTWHSVPMPAIAAYKCEIRGQLGDPHSEMNSVSMTIAGLPDVGLGQMTTRIPEENTAVENLILRGFKRQAGLLRLDAAEWHVELTASYASDNKDAWPLHHINLSRKDGSPFRLPRDIDTSIVDALRLFLAFQCGRWVNIPTIVCNPVFTTTEKQLVLREGETSEDALSALRKYRASHDWHEAMDELNDSLQKTRGFEDVSGAHILGIHTSAEQATITFGKGDPTIRLVWVGKIATREISRNNSWTATEMRMWPSLFKEFWSRYNEPDSREHLRNVVSHYVEAQRVFDDSSIGQALVAAQSTLQALTRWWNGSDIDDKFGPPGPTFDHLLIKGVREAKLGQDSGVVIDEEVLRARIKVATEYRNDIDHGRGRNIEGQEQDVINHRMHHHNLARLLILAKMGNRNRDARGSLVGPVFQGHAK